MLTLTSLARADRHMLLNAGNDVQRWWRLVYTVLTGMVELLRVGICGLTSIPNPNLNTTPKAPTQP